jgi:hypothetical protein
VWSVIRAFLRSRSGCQNCDLAGWQSRLKVLLLPFGASDALIRALACATAWADRPISATRDGEKQRPSSLLLPLMDLRPRSQEMRANLPKRNGAKYHKLD